MLASTRRDLYRILADGDGDEPTGARTDASAGPEPGDGADAGTVDTDK